MEDVLERMMQEVRMEEYECEAEIDDDAGMETGGSSEGNTPAGEHSMRG